MILDLKINTECLSSKSHKIKLSCFVIKSQFKTYVQYIYYIQYSLHMYIFFYNSISMHEKRNS